MKYTQKLGLIISLATSIVILATFGIFLVLFYSTSTAQVRKSLLGEAKEVMDNYVRYTDNYLQIINRDDLARDTVRDSLSLMIFDNELKPIDYFGLFSEDKSYLLFDDNEKFINKLNEVKKDRKLTFESLKSIKSGDSHILLIYPLTKNSEYIGSMVLISPIENINIILNNSISLILFILPLSIIFMYFLGQKLSYNALKPIRELNENIQRINFLNLQSNVKTDGHVEDDAYRLTVEFNKMIERVKEGVDKQKLFISNSSHELRTPLARLQTSIDLIKGNTNLKKELSDEISRMADTLTRLSILTKIKNRKMESKKIHLKEYIEKNIENIKERKRILNLVNDKVIIKFDPRDLKIIIDNLINNALKYSKDQVILDFKKNSLIIKDKGIGIPNSDKSSIFTPFFRSKNALLNEIEGTGLGLSIVKEICDIYGYSLNVISEVNKGTTITINFD